MAGQQLQEVSPSMASPSSSSSYCPQRLQASIRSGRLRWAVNSEDWAPIGAEKGPEFQFLLSLIQETDDRQQVTKYMRFQDQKRALISRLLVRHASASVLGLSSFRDVEIARTKGKKPFLRKPRPVDIAAAAAATAAAPDCSGEGTTRTTTSSASSVAALANFNFSVSHEGDWVVLASEPICVCGVDVAAPQEVRPGGCSPSEIFRDLEDQLTEAEWEFVRKQGASSGGPEGEDPLYSAFQRHWCLKEAYVKARGDGLEFPFNRIEFQLRPASLLDEEAAAGRRLGFAGRVDGVDLNPRWRFYQQRLPGNHWTAVARGPTTEVIDAFGEFKRTFTRPTDQLPPSEVTAELEAEEPPFEILPVAFLVPTDHIEGYEAAGGQKWQAIDAAAA